MEQNTTATTNETASGKQKNENGLKIATVIASVVAVCGIGFGVYGMMRSSQNQISNIKVQVKDEDGTTTTVKDNLVAVDGVTNTITISGDISDGDEEVEAVIEQISGVADDYMGTHLVKTFNESFPHWKIAGTDIVTQMEKSYGIYSGTWLNNKEIENKLFSVYQIVETLLENNGYTRQDSALSLSPVYYNAKTKIVCEFDEGSEPWRLGCAKTDWISEEREQLIIELAEASGANHIDLGSTGIVNSSIAPYQRLLAGSQVVGLMFYRVSPDAKWQFIAASQDLVSCDKFNEDAKKAYAGERCWNSVTNSVDTL